MTKKNFLKYREPLMYIFFGVLTTVVNYSAYIFLSRGLNWSVMLANGTAFITAIVFAYMTNRTWVFTSYAKTSRAVLKEASEFFAARFVGFLLDMSLMFVFVKLLGVNDFLMKGLSNVIVIVLNYIISKYIIFKPIEEK